MSGCTICFRCLAWFGHVPYGGGTASWGRGEAPAAQRGRTTSRPTRIHRILWLAGRRQSRCGSSHLQPPVNGRCARCACRARDRPGSVGRPAAVVLDTVAATRFADRVEQRLTRRLRHVARREPRGRPHMRHPGRPGDRAFPFVIWRPFPIAISRMGHCGARSWAERPFWGMRGRRNLTARTQ